MQHLLAAHSLPEKQRLFSNSADFIHWEQIRGGDGRLALVMTRNTVEGSEGNIGWRVAESNWQGGHLLSLFVFPFEGPLTTNLFKKKPLPPTQAGRTGHSHSSQPSATVLEDDEADVLQAGGGALAEVHPLHAGQQLVDPLHSEVVGPARPRPRSGGHPPPDVSNSSSSQ